MIIFYPEVSYAKVCMTADVEKYIRVKITKLLHLVVITLY